MIETSLDFQVAMYIAGLVIMIVASIIVVKKERSLASIAILAGVIAMVTGTFFINCCIPEVSPSPANPEGVPVYFNPNIFGQIGFWLSPIGTLTFALGFLVHVLQNRKQNS